MDRREHLEKVMAALEVLVEDQRVLAAITPPELPLDAQLSRTDRLAQAALASAGHSAKAVAAMASAIVFLLADGSENDTGG
jgi:hypothetical protein